MNQNSATAAGSCQHWDKSWNSFHLSGGVAINATRRHTNVCVTETPRPGGRWTRSYSGRRCHRVTEGLPCENTANPLTCKTTPFLIQVDVTSLNSQQPQTFFSQRAATAADSLREASECNRKPWKRKPRPGGAFLREESSLKWQDCTSSLMRTKCEHEWLPIHATRKRAV